MIVALDTMDATVKGIFFLVAVVLFLIAAFYAYAPRRGEGRVAPNFVALGLAFFAFPFMWDAFALGG